MRFILIRINQVYYIKDMETLKTYNTTIVEDLRQIRDLINSHYEAIIPYHERETRICEILNCKKNED
ncbi:hypothetical protein [Methanobrevibacter sp.]|jgi:hypothetical protein|uniref:hypothetical protein n=1 Tax=Methanobrevibacter sp. TaxID=66852 RepID=UPI00386836E3